MIMEPFVLSGKEHLAAFRHYWITTFVDFEVRDPKSNPQVF